MHGSILLNATMMFYHVNFSCKSQSVRTWNIWMHVGYLFKFNFYRYCWWPWLNYMWQHTQDIRHQDRKSSAYPWPKQVNPLPKARAMWQRALKKIFCKSSRKLPPHTTGKIDTSRTTSPKMGLFNQPRVKYHIAPVVPIQTTTSPPPLQATQPLESKLSARIQSLDTSSNLLGLII